MANTNSPSIGKSTPVLITHVEFEKGYCIGYGQFCDADIVEALSEQVLQSATAGVPIQSCLVGDVVLALYRDDENWYRAKIVSVNPDNLSLSVFFIDYGNSEEIYVSDARVAPNELKQLPSLAKKCVFEDVNPSCDGIWSDSDKEKLQDDLINKEFTAEITDITNRDLLVVALHTDSEQYQFGKKSTSNSETSLTAVNLSVGESYQSYIAYVESANKFWIQLKQFELNLEKLMQEVSNFVESEARPLPQAKRGTCCIAKFSDDDVPYRSKVLGMTGDKCLVQFVDYGNSESKSLSDLMILPEQFCQLPIQGFKCCYKRSKLKSNALDEKVQELTSEENGIVVKVVSKSGDEYTVEIDKIEEISITESSEARAFTSLQLDLNKDFDVCISHVYHPGRFYVQIIENATIIDSLMEKISNEFNSNPNLSILSNGMVGIAKLSDGACYRSVIRSMQKDSAFVLAIDFGFEEWVTGSQVREISSRCMQIPAQALECTVDSTKTEEKYWSTKEINILSVFESKEPLIAKITAKRGSIFQLDLHDTTDPELDRYINAELLGIGKNSDSKVIPNAASNQTTKITKELISIPPPEVIVGEKKLVCVTAIMSSNQFYVQMTNHINEIAELQKQLHVTYENYNVSEGCIRNIRTGDICCTRYVDGGWYRALVTSVEQGQIIVSFVDFGDSTSCNLTDLKELQKKYAILPQQCIIGKISNLNAGLTKETAETVLTNQVIEVQIGEQKEFPFPLYEIELTNHPNNNKILQRLKGQPAVPRIPRGPINASQISTTSLAESLDDYQATVVSLYSEEEVMVTHVINPEQFHCQLKKYATHLDDLMQLLDNHCKKLGPNDDCIDNIHLGLPCLAKFSTDSCWYRAKITGILAGNNLIEVLFVDYGNTECQERDGLKKVHPKLMNLPAQAIFCGLSGIATTQGFWSPEHITQFEDLTLDQNFNTVFKKWNKEEDRYSVEMKNLSGESFNLKFGSMSNSLCPEQSDDNKYTGRSGRTQDGDVGSRNFGRQQMGNSDGGFGAASSSFGGRSNDRKGGFGGRFGGSDDSGRGGKSAGFGGDRGGRSSGFGGDRGGRSSGFGGDRGGGRGGFGGDRGGGRGGFGGDRNTGFRGSVSNNNADEDRSSGFGGSRSFGGDRGSRGGGFGSDRGGRSGGFGRDNDDGTSGSSRGHGGFGGSRGGRTGGFGQDENNSSDQGSGRRGGFNGEKSGGFGGGRGGRSGGFGQDKEDQGSGFGGKRGGFGGDRGGGRGGHGGFGRDQNDQGDNGFRGGRRGGFGGDRGGSRGSRGGFGNDGGFGSDRGGFGGDRGSRSGGFGGDRGARSGGKGGGFGGKTTTASVGADWGDNSSSTPAKQPAKSGFGQSAGEGDNWNVKPTNTSTMIHTDSGDTGDKWEHKNLDRFAAQKLVLGKAITASIVYSITPGEFWCQNSEQVPALDTMSEKMNSEYNNLSEGELNLSKAEIKKPCVAMFSEDEQWYRAEITNTEGSELEVYFVDYGNTEKVSRSSVKTIKSEYFNLPIQGIKCSFNNAKPEGNGWSEKSNEDFTTLTVDKSFKVKLVSHSNGLYLVEVKYLDTNEDLAVKLTELGHGILATGTLTVISPYQSTTLPQDTSKEVFVSWIDSPHSFWIQPAEASDKLLELVDQIQEEYTSGPSASISIKKTEVGTPVIAQYSEDDAWYRAYIESVSGKKYKVRFIDYGNPDTLEFEQLREPTEPFLNIGAHAIRCRLAGVKPLQTGTWNVDAKDIMESLVGQDAVTCNVKFSSDKEHIVEITTSTTNVTEELIQTAVARKDDGEAEKTEQNVPMTGKQVKQPLPSRSVPVGTSVSGYVGSVVSPSKHFIQLAGEESNLDKLASSLQSSYTENPGESTKTANIGEYYCTKYTEDDAWYRALVEEVKGNVVTVCFIDYGNSKDVNMVDLKLLKEDFVKLPPFAVKCCLHGVGPVEEQWSDDAIAAFEEATSDQKLTVTFVTASQVSITNTEGDVGQLLVSGGHAKIKTDETKIVKIDEQIKPEGEVTVCISSVEDKRFYLQLTSQETILQELQDQLQTLCITLPSVQIEMLAIGDHCFGLFSEDSNWYRAVVTNIDGKQVTVTFVDYGNGETLSSDRLRCLHKDTTSPAMAYYCCLDGCENADPAVIEPRLSALTESTQLKAVFTGMTDKIYKVVLIEDGKNINEELSDKDAVLTDGGMLVLDETGDAHTLSEVEGKLESKFVTVDQTGLCDSIIETDVEGDEGKLESKFVTVDQTGLCDSIIETDVEGDEGKLESKFVTVDQTGLCDSIIETDVEGDEGELDNDLVILDQTGDSIVVADIRGNEGDIDLDQTVPLADINLTLDKTGYSDSFNETVDVDEQIEDIREPVINKLSELKQQILKEGERISVNISYTESPSKFYIQKEEHTGKLETLVDDMFNWYETLSEDQYKMSTVEPGMICAVKFTDDDSWYRGKIMSVEGEDITVFFLDHGNSEEMTVKSIKQLLTKFSELPIQGIACVLSDIGAPDDNWSEDDINLFTQLTENKTLLADIVGFGKGKTCIVQLLDMGISVSKSMIDKAHGIVATTPRVNTRIRRVFSNSSDVTNPMKMPSLSTEDSLLEETFFGYSRLPLEADKDYTVKVTHVENPTCFWCQIVDPENKLQKLIDSLQEKYIDSTDTVDKIDTACIAKCKGDGLFYRGVTRSNVENGEIVVLFVDYGSVYYIEASEVKSIKGEDLELPIQAVDCMLHDIDLDESQDDWDETVCEYFERLLDDTTLSMKVKQVCNEGVSVYLYDGGIDLSIDLADKGFVNLVNTEYNTLLKDGPWKRESAEILGRILSTDCEYRVIISHVETPSCFYVLFKDNAVESIEEKINSVVEINSNDVLQEEDLIQGMLCLACCKDVNDWQRAKIENIQEDCVMVLLIDIGSRELKQEKDLRKIPENISCYPPQAFLCQLEDIKPLDDQTDWSEDTIVYFKDICPVGEEMEIYFTERDEDKLKVFLYDVQLNTKREEDQQIGVQLVKLGFSDCVPGSFLEKIIMDEENNEPLFNEMSLNRENSYGSTEEQDTSANDESSLYTCDDTTDVSMGPQDSELDTTASDSFAYVNFKPVPDITADTLDGINKGKGDDEVTKGKYDDEDDEFYDAEEESKIDEASMATEKSENQQNLCKNNSPDEITTNSDTDFVRNDAEADDENQIKKSDGGEVDADSDEEDTMKCASDEEEEHIVKEVGEKLEKCLIEDKLNSQELNAEHGNLESEENNVPEDMTVKGETVDDNDSTIDLKESTYDQSEATAKDVDPKELIEQFIKYSVEDVAIEKNKKEMSEQNISELETKDTDADNNNLDMDSKDIVDQIQDQMGVLEVKDDDKRKDERNENVEVKNTDEAKDDDDERKDEETTNENQEVENIDVEVQNEERKDKDATIDNDETNENEDVKNIDVVQDQDQIGSNEVKDEEGKDKDEMIENEEEKNIDEDEDQMNSLVVEDDVEAKVDEINDGVKDTVKTNNEDRISNEKDMLKEVEEVSKDTSYGDMEKKEKMQN